ncbi:MAG: PQQ-binding-like beta-propeller repeat protein [Zetaproteobacteria bacterium]|nr:PQQ-binding-like beta-propeller repeat protein [Zetaproteobacteria bacterium]
MTAHDSWPGKLCLAGWRFFSNSVASGGACVALVLTSCVSPTSPSPYLTPRVEVEKVTRAGVLNFVPELDAKKVLSHGDFGGWVKSGSLWLGEVEERYLGAFVTPGKAAWLAKLGSSVAAPLFLSGENLIVALQDGRVLSLRVRDGKLNWEQNLGTMVVRQMSRSGQVLFMVTAEDKLYCLDYASGVVKWFYGDKKGSGVALRQLTAPLLVKNVVVYGLRDGSIHGVDKNSGNLRWIYRSDAVAGAHTFLDIVGDLALVNKSIMFARADGLVDSFDLDDHGGLVKEKSPRLRQASHLSAINVASFTAGVYYVGTESGDVVALQSARGEQLWKTALGSPVSMLYSTESFIFASTLSGRLVILAAKDGRVVWSDMLESTLLVRPLLEDGRLYVSTPHKVIYSYELRSLRKHFE